MGTHVVAARPLGAPVRVQSGGPARQMAPSSRSSESESPPPAGESPAPPACQLAARAPRSSPGHSTVLGLVGGERGGNMTRRCRRWLLELRALNVLCWRLRAKVWVEVVQVCVLPWDPRLTWLSWQAMPGWRWSTSRWWLRDVSVLKEGAIWRDQRGDWSGSGGGAGGATSAKRAWSSSLGHAGRCAGCSWRHCRTKSWIRGGSLVGI